MYKYVSSTKMFYVYTAAPRPTQERSHQPHRKTSTSTETNPHQQIPKYTQHTPKTGTHGEQAPPHLPVHTTTESTPMPTLDRDMQKQQHHTKPTISGSPSQRTRTSPSAISPTTPREPGSPKANPEHPNSKGTKVVIINDDNLCKEESKIIQFLGNIKFI